MNIQNTIFQNGLNFKDEKDYKNFCRMAITDRASYIGEYIKSDIKRVGESEIYYYNTTTKYGMLFLCHHLKHLYVYF